MKIYTGFVTSKESIHSNERKESSFSRYVLPLLLVISLMFFWNFCRNINDILIPHLKRSCQLNDLQSSFVQSAFFGAYFLMSLPAGYFIEKYGYKSGMVTGLLFAAAGAILFYPAALTHHYPFFLTALFIMASGFTFLEVTVTPYISRLGAQDQASSRLSFAAAVGSLGSAIGPYAGSIFLLHQEDVSEATISSFTPAQLDIFLNNEAHLVIKPYLTLGFFFLSLALLFFFLKLPEIQEKLNNQKKRFYDVFKSRHTMLGVIAVFCYLGAEVGIVSFFIRYAKNLNIFGLTEQKSALFITLYMLLVLFGRVSGAYLLKYYSPGKILALCTVGAFILVTASIVTTGYTALYTLSMVGLFTSIMYPVIFTLSIKDLGDLTKAASSLLIMGCVGGALIPPVMGLVSDISGIKLAFIVPLICYLYVLYYAVKGHVARSIKSGLV